MEFEQCRRISWQQSLGKQLVWGGDEIAVAENDANGAELSGEFA